MRGFKPNSLKASFLFLLTICCFPESLLAGGLSISPVADPINFGDVYAYEKNR